jgi:hypothetical protein
MGGEEKGTSMQIPQEGDSTNNTCFFSAAEGGYVDYKNGLYR